MNICHGLCDPACSLARLGLQTRNWLGAYATDADNRVSCSKCYVRYMHAPDNLKRCPCCGSLLRRFRYRGRRLRRRNAARRLATAAGRGGSRADAPE